MTDTTTDTAESGGSMFVAKVQWTEVASIRVREDRQRRSLDPDRVAILADSIRRIGLIHPIVIDTEGFLVAGEYRLRAYAALGLDRIETRLNKSDDPKELEIIELEENVKRSDLSWQDQARAIARLHTAFKALEPAWTEEKTAAVVGIDRSYVNRNILLAEEMEAGNKGVLDAQEISQANTVMKRARGRAKEEVAKILFDDAPQAKPVGPDTPAPEVLCADFIEWSSSVRGPKFSFIHCDFPYGVGLDKSGQMSKGLGTYADGEDIFFTLLSAFVRNFQNFAFPMAHVMFWYSEKFGPETRAALSSIPGARVFEHPLIWHKADGKGIVSDPLRRPRHTYETALFVSVGDRQIRKITNDSVAVPTDESRGHPSRKPPSVLGHFFPLFLAPGDRMLDPTCGSGSSLQVAKAMGAEVLGLELDADFAAGIKL